MLTDELLTSTFITNMKVQKVNELGYIKRLIPFFRNGKIWVENEISNNATITTMSSSVCVIYSYHIMIFPQDSYSHVLI